MGASEPRPSLKTIAENLGLGTNTVSRALRGGNRVSPATLELVRAEARRIGYVPNSVAQALVRGGRTNQIGLVITNPSNPFYAELISAVERRCRQLGHSLHLMVTEENPENEEYAVDAMLRWQTRSAIVVPSEVSPEPWERLRAAGAHIVAVNRPLGPPCDYVGIDYEQGAHAATKHLIDSGFWPIRVFEEDLQISTVRARLDGVSRAVREHGGELTEMDIVRVTSPRLDDSTLPWQPRSAYEAALDTVPNVEPGTGIVAGTDLLALGIYRAASESGRSVPGDIGVVGQGDHAFSAFLTPTLTSLQPPATEIGVAAVDLAVRRLTDPDDDGGPVERTFACSLQIRGSSRRDAATATD